MKTWQKGEIYNFSEEFNRIENYNKYCQDWLKTFGVNVNITNKIDWIATDIVDISDLNRVKSNINSLLNGIASSTSELNISTQINQNWTYAKANEIEMRLNEIVNFITNIQFKYEITGLAITGNFLKLGGVD